MRADRLVLEAALGRPLDRYGPYRKNPEKTYAQLNIESGDQDDWHQINAWLEECGAAIGVSLDEGLVSTATLDVAYEFPESMASISRTIPARSAFLAGQHGIDIMVSIYPVSEK